MPYEPDEPFDESDYPEKSLYPGAIYQLTDKGVRGRPKKKLKLGFPIPEKEEPDDRNEQRVTDEKSESEVNQGNDLS